MAVGAHSSFCVAMQNGPSMNALLIRDDRTVADPGLIHHRAAAVARAASLCDVRSVDCRSGITRRKDRSHIPAQRVTVKTARGVPSVLNGSRVKAVIVSLVRISVKLAA